MSSYFENVINQTSGEVGELATTGAAASADESLREALQALGYED